jgi:hypothetical protein
MRQWYQSTMVASVGILLDRGLNDALPGTAVDYGASETIKRPDTVRS